MPWEIHPTHLSAKIKKSQKTFFHYQSLETEPGPCGHCGGERSLVLLVHYQTENEDNMSNAAFPLKPLHPCAC